MVPPTPAAPMHPPAAPPAPVKKKRKGCLIAVLVTLALLLLAGAGILAAVFLLGNSGSRAQGFAYLRDGNELMYLSNLRENTEALKTGGDLSSDTANTGSVKFSPDGRQMFFLDDSGALYRVSTGQLKREEAKPQRIDRDVYSFTPLKNGGVLYNTSDSNGGSGSLFCWSGEEKYRVSRSCGEYQLSQDEKTLYYTEWDESWEACALYRRGLDEDAETEELIGEATTIYTALDSPLLVYGVDTWDPDGEGEQDGNSLTVYACRPGEEAEELLSAVWGIDGVTAEDGQARFYYTVENRTPRTLYDLVEDSTLAEDAALTAQSPQPPDWHDNFYPVDYFVENGQIRYHTEDGNSYPLDVSPFLYSFGMSMEELLAYLADPDYEEQTVYWLTESCYQEISRRYEDAMEAYSQQRRSYREAQDRDILREQLEGIPYSLRSYSLYCYDGAPASQPLAGEISPSQYLSCPEAGVFLYKKIREDSGAAVCALTDLTSVDDIYSFLDMDAADTESPWYQLFGGTERELDLDEELGSIYDLFPLGGTEIVLELEREGAFCLEAYSTGEAGLVRSGTIAENLPAGFSVMQSGGEALCFLEQTEAEEKGDLVRYAGGETTVLAEDVYGACLLENGGGIYLVTGKSERGREIARLQEEGGVLDIADEVSKFLFPDEKRMLYLSDGDLYLWDGTENRRVARDVSCFWSNQEEDYAFLSSSYYY